MDVNVGLPPRLSVGFASGTPDKHYTHTQASASEVWEITHNLGKHPAVTCADTAGTEIIGEIQYTTVNTLTVTFSARNAGKAYCN